MSDELKDGGILTITDEKSKNASVGAPRPVIPSSLCCRKCQKRSIVKQLDQVIIVHLSFGMLINDAGQVTTVPGDGFGKRLNASGVVPLTSLYVTPQQPSWEVQRGDLKEKCDPPPCGGNCCNPCCRAFGRSYTSRSGWRSP